MLALRDRRPHRSLVDDAGTNVLARAGRIGRGDGPRRDQADADRFAALDPSFADPFIGGEQRLGLPGAEAPVHEAHRFLDALVEAAETGDDHDETAAILLGRAGEAIARFRGMTGLETVGALDAAEQGVPV